MIAWATAGAWAGPFQVDVLALPVTARTAAITATSEVLDVDGRPVESPFPAASPGWGGRGAQLEVGRYFNDTSQWVAAVGYRQDDATFELAQWTFRPVLRELLVQGGFLAFPERKRVPPIDLYVAGYTGVQLQILNSDPFDPPILTPGWATALSLGVATRTLPVRVRVEGRVEVVPRLDVFTGRAEQPTSAFLWRAPAGYAAASLLVGIGAGTKPSADE